MDTKITAKDITRLTPVVQMAYRISYPDGLTMQELRDSKLGWLRAIYEHCKEREGV